MSKSYAEFSPRETMETSCWNNCSPAERRIWATLLAATMRASRARRDRTALAIFRSIGRTFGPQAAICSTVLLAQCAGGPWREVLAGSQAAYAGIFIVDAEGNEVDIEAVPYGIRWAARMVAAWINDDTDNQVALMRAAIADGELGACIPELARMAAAGDPMVFS